MEQKKRIVVMGGGTGSFAVLSGLRQTPHYISAIVSMADHGGSTGILRDELGVLPPGDVRQCLVALAEESGLLRELFTYRVKTGIFRGHAFGNLFLATLEKMSGSFEKAVETAALVLNIKGEVIPVTLNRVELNAHLSSGRKLKSEPAVTKSKHLHKYDIQKIYLHPKPKPNPKAIRAIQEADLFVLAPGNLYASLIPNLLVPGIPEAIAASPARKVYVCNLMTQNGHTNAFTVQRFVAELERWAGRPLFNTVIYNTEKPPPHLLAQYMKEGEPVRFDPAVSANGGRDVQFVAQKLLGSAIFRPQDGDPLAAQRSFIRHDPEKLARALLKLFV